MSTSIAQRSVLPEILDDLPPDDPRAQRSRRDLQRVNRMMGSRSILLSGLRSVAGRPRPAATPLRLLELGAGDGRLMLRVARALARGGGHAEHAQPWRTVELQLLDRLALLTPDTIEAYARLGWQARVLSCDVRDWVAAAADGLPYDAIVVNLFLHHFEPEPLRTLLAGVAARCHCFVASEPRRAARAVLGTHLMGLIGASRLTRHDGLLSVRAGFRDHELSALWPTAGSTMSWTLEERAAGLFGHFFAARRVAPARGAVV